jgi:nucleosome binding factor SPN SPT16 subunit
MSIEIMYRALQSNRVIMFINDRQQGLMEARFGYGPDIRRYVGNLTLHKNDGERFYAPSNGCSCC